MDEDDQPARHRVQVVVAHPDDETFGCGSLLLHAAAAGARTAVCCATRGEAGEIAGGFRPVDLGVVRERELRDAAALLGVDQVDLLEFRDSGMAGPAGPGTLAGASFESVRDAVQARLSGFRPDVLITLDASDGHRDHARIRDASLAAARAAGVPRVYLQCLPRSLMQRWIDLMRADRPENRAPRRRRCGPWHTGRADHYGHRRSGAPGRARAGDRCARLADLPVPRAP